MRFKEWKSPNIQEGKLTKWNWVVQNSRNLRLGNRVDIGSFTYINAKYGVTIEDEVQVGSHCSIYSISTIDNKSGPVVLEKNCRIGSHCVIMPNVRVGKDSVVGALSFVNMDLPECVMAVGVPVKIIKKISKRK